MAGVFPSSLLRAFQAAPDVPAFEHGARSLTRAETVHLVARLAGGLARAGLQPGDSIALATSVTPEAFAAQIAGHLLGLRIVALKPGIPTSALSLILSDVDLLIVDESPPVDLPPALLASTTKLRVLRLSSLPAEPIPLLPQGRPDQTALITHTSGSTGVPKGVEHTYGSLTSAWQWSPPSLWDADGRRLAARYGRYLLFGTLASAVMLEHLGLCLMVGGTAVIATGTAGPSFGIPHVLARLRITAVLFTVPRLGAVLDVLRNNNNNNHANHAPKSSDPELDPDPDPEPDPDLSHLESILIAGSPLAPHQLAAARTLLGRHAVHQGYGTNETGMLCLLTPDDMSRFPHTVERGTVGRAWTGVELSVRDDQGRVVTAPGTVGNVWARTPGQFRGYKYTYTGEGEDDGEKGAEEGEVLGQDGFVCTRDRGYLDGDGFLYLTGRTRDVVIVNAVVHYAAAIEVALAAHPDVDAAYVVGVPDERTGEAVVAFVVPVGGAAQVLDREALCGMVEQRLGKGAVPARIVAVDGVPLLPSGKPDKQALLKHIS